MAGCGNETAVYFFCPGCQQHAGAFTGSRSGGNDIVKEQNTLAPHVLRADSAVCTQHIGSALCLTLNAVGYCESF